MKQVEEESVLVELSSMEDVLCLLIWIVGTNQFVTTLR